MELYNIWLKKIQSLLPEEDVRRQRNFARIIYGIYKAQSVHLSKIASKLSGESQKLSKVKQIDRFLENDYVKPDEWYQESAKAVLKAIADTGGMIRLIIDGSKVGFCCQLLMVSVAYRRRSIPIAWTWVKHKRGHSTVKRQTSLLTKVKELIPEGASVSLVGDSEFGKVDLLETLESWQWFYALRQSGRELYQSVNANDGLWHKLSKSVTKGKSIDLGQVHLTQQKAHQTRLVAHWNKNEDTPWLLATNFPTMTQTLKAYKPRMWIEEMFGDFKGHGCDLESSHIRDDKKLDRLTLAVVFIYLWLVAFGSKVIKRGLRYLVDRRDRRDLSIYRIGFDMVERLIANRQSLSIFLSPYH